MTANSDLFWTIFSAVLAAGLLVVCFVWAGVNVSRREERKEPLGVYFIGFLLPLAFLIMGLVTVL